MGRIIDCKPLRDKLLKRAKDRDRKESTFLIINDKSSEASEVYVRNKVKLCLYLGISPVIRESLAMRDLHSFDYIMVQKPCSWYNERMIEHIPPERDAD